MLTRLSTLIVCALATCACSSLRDSYVKPYSAAFAPPANTATARYVAQKTSDHSGESGFRLLIDNNDALMSRVVLADKATTSIDLQYYIFDNDETGRLISQRLLAAADRGVRVRLLVDDMDAGDAEHLLDALDAHPHIQVRLFNPFHTRNPSTLSRMGQFLIDGPRLNRRMHNKSFIVDNTVAIIGGRNIGNAYFLDRDAQHFADMDVVAIGPVVPQASSAFDTYWNASEAYPVKAFDTTTATRADTARLHTELETKVRTPSRSDYAAALVDALPGGKTVENPGQWLWGDARQVADKPQKIDGDNDGNASLRIEPKLDSLIGAAQKEVLLISAYFVPGDEDTNFFVSLAKRGVKVKVLTNSLAATDEPLVHAGYVRFRHKLLEGGVQLFELRPAPGKTPQATAYGKSSGVSLHAKSIVIDREVVFIGSMNMDERSKLLNTEMGVVADSSELAEAAGVFFDNATSPANAFEVKLDHGGLVWCANDSEGKPVRYEHEPDVSMKRRLEISLLRVLPIDGML